MLNRFFRRQSQPLSLNIGDIVATGQQIELPNVQPELESDPSTPAPHPLQGAVKLLEFANESYTSAQHTVYFGTGHPEKHQMIALPETGDGRATKQFDNSMALVEESLANTNIYGLRAESLAHRLTDELNTMRGGALTSREAAVLDYARNFRQNLGVLCTSASEVGTLDKGRIKNCSYFSPADGGYAKEMYSKMVDLKVRLEIALDRTKGLIDLESKTAKAAEHYSS